MSLSTYIKSPGKNVSGNMYVFLAEKDNITSITVSGGEVTEIVMDVGSYFHQIQAEKNTIIFTEEEDDEIRESVWYEHRISFEIGHVNKSANTLIDSLIDAIQSGIIAIVTNSNGHSWLVGYNEIDGLRRALKVEESTYTAGEWKAGNKTLIQLVSRSAYPSLPLNNTLNLEILTAIITGGGTPVTLGFTPSSETSIITEDGNVIITEDGQIIVIE